MKTQSFLPKIFFFTLVCIFFLIPPFRQINAKTIQFTWNFPVNELFLLFSSILIVYFCKIYFCSFPLKNLKPFSPLRYLISSGRIMMLYGILLVTGTIFTVISMKTGFQNNVSADKPEGINILFFIMRMSFSAFYEETIYRFYVPLNLKWILQKLPFSSVISEILSSLIFAFSHFYLGPSGILNALISHCVLRYSLLKNNNLILNTTAHALYNITNIILSFFM